MRTDEKRSTKRSKAKALLASVLSFGTVGTFAKAPAPPRQASPSPGDQTPPVDGK